MIQLLIAATATFFLLQLIPGDPVLVMLGDEVTKERADALRHELGLDKPIANQFVSWLVNAAQLDLGNSITSGRPVVDEVMRRLPRTLELSAAGLLIAIAMGFPIGIIAAIRRGSLLDLGSNVIAVIGFSVPVFVAGFLMVLVLSMKLGWLPAVGYIPFSQNPGGHLLRLLMPAIAVSLGITAVTTRLVRSTTLEAMSKDYVRTARAKGVSSIGVLLRHVVRNSLIPVVTVLGYYFAQTFGGSILTERIFNWPGLSFLLIDSIQQRDYPMIQGVLLVIVALFLLVNLLVDLVIGLMDPRIRYG